MRAKNNAYALKNIIIDCALCDPFGCIPELAYPTCWQPMLRLCHELPAFSRTLFIRLKKRVNLYRKQTGGRRHSVAGTKQFHGTVIAQYSLVFYFTLHFTLNNGRLTKCAMPHAR
jgi:hypothetical protein